MTPLTRFAQAAVVQTASGKVQFRVYATVDVRVA